MLITILTPSYNRAHTLNRLYKSLLRQTNKNFEWLIVDDGSTDNTKKVVDSFINDNKISINYIFQLNGGKHRALNTGIKNIDSELTFIVDSDDFLKNDAVENIEFFYNKYKDDKTICGFSFLRCFLNGNINGPLFKENEYKSDYITCRINEKNWGDKAEVYYTYILKKYPFLEVEGEKFLSECYVWGQIAEKYDMIHINKAIYVGEYLDDGLTSNMNIRKYNSPIGYSSTFNMMCNNKTNLINKIKFTLIYAAYSYIAKISILNQFKKSRSKILYILLFPFGLLYMFYIKNRLKKGHISGKRE